jgi:hypothetical protein
MSKNYEIINVTNFKNFSDIEVSELNKDPPQMIAFINIYQNNSITKFVIKTDPIQITSRGIPKLSNENDMGYYPDDSRREFIHIGLDLKQPACVQFKLFLEKADDFFGSVHIRKKLFGRRSDEFEYQPLIKKIRSCDDDDDYVNKKKQQPKPPDHIKIKFIVDLIDGHRIMRTRLINYGKQINAKTVTDIASYVKFNTVACFTVHFRKIWANKCSAPGSKKKHYGVGLAMIEIDTTTQKSTFIELGKPIYDKDGLKKAYKKYMDEKKNPIHKNVIIEI